jgi:hypothetical protein
MATTRRIQSTPRSADANLIRHDLIRVGTASGWPAGGGTPPRGLHKIPIHGKKDFSDELKIPFSESFFPTCLEWDMGNIQDPAPVCRIYAVRTAKFRHYYPRQTQSFCKKLQGLELPADAKSNLTLRITLMWFSQPNYLFWRCFVQRGKEPILTLPPLT